VLLGIVKQLENIIAHDDTSLAAEYVFGTHVCGLFVVVKARYLKNML
jgi:hypothetical protein